MSLPPWMKFVLASAAWGVTVFSIIFMFRTMTIGVTIVSLTWFHVIALLACYVVGMIVVVYSTNKFLEYVDRIMR